MELTGIISVICAVLFLIGLIVSQLYLKRRSEDLNDAIHCVEEKANHLKTRIKEAREKVTKESIFDMDLKCLLHSIEEWDSCCKNNPQGVVLCTAAIIRYEAYLESLITLENYSNDVDDKEKALDVVKAIVSIQIKMIDRGSDTEFGDRLATLYSSANVFLNAQANENSLKWGVSIYAKILHHKMYDALI